jgi:hypothetical protein
MSAPQELVDLLRASNVPVFVKTDNYVPAHIGLVPGSRTVGDDWDEERMRDYLYGEASLNNRGGYARRGYVMIFLGDAKYHSWVRAYRVTFTGDVATGSYLWERID